MTGRALKYIYFVLAVVMSCSVLRYLLHHGYRTSAEFILMKDALVGVALAYFFVRGRRSQEPALLSSRWPIRLVLASGLSDSLVALLML